MAWYQPTDDKERANKSRNEKPSRGGCPTGNTGLDPELKPAEVTVVHNEWRMKRLQISDESPKAQNWKTPEIGNSPEKKEKKRKKKQPNLKHDVKFIQTWIQQKTIPLGLNRVSKK